MIAGAFDELIIEVSVTCGDSKDVLIVGRRSLVIVDGRVSGMGRARRVVEHAARTRRVVDAKGWMGPPGLENEPSRSKGGSNAV